MARKLDPNNLSVGDVLRLLAPTIAVIAGLFLVVRYAPDFVWLFIVLLMAGFFIILIRLPKKDLAAIAESERDFEDKLGGIPVVGRAAKPAWRVLNWLATIFGALMLLLFVWGLLTT